MARRVHSLHHNLQEGQNVVFHHEHRSKKGRKKGHEYRRRLAGFLKERRDRIVERRWKKNITDFVKGAGRDSMTV